MVVFPLKCTCIPYLPHVCLILSAVPLVYGIIICSMVFLVCSVVSCDDGLVVVVVCDAIVVSACNGVGGAVVSTCILLVAVNNFILYPFNGPVWVIAIAQSSP